MHDHVANRGETVFCCQMVCVIYYSMDNAFGSIHYLKGFDDGGRAVAIQCWLRCLRVWLLCSYVRVYECRTGAYFVCVVLDDGWYV